MRLFVSLQLEDDLKAELVRARSALERRFEDGIRYVTPEQLHLTLRFIGEADETQRSLISEALKAITPSISSFEVALGGLGCFPEEPKAAVRIVWASLKSDSSAFIELAQKCEDAIQRVGFEAETRTFTPHITIARVKFDKTSGRLREAASVLVVKPFSQSVKSISLMSSVTDSKGPVYENIETFLLGQRRCYA